MSDDSQAPRIAPFGLRMPPDLKDRVSRAAEANNRSMNAEIVAALEEKYPVPVEDLTLDTVREWSLQILAATTARERGRRMREANAALAKDPRWQGWRIGVSNVPDSTGKKRRLVGVFGPVPDDVEIVFPARAREAGAA